MKRVGIYVRVSTQEQATEGYSIGAQIERLNSYCVARDWGVHKIYKDAGFSGSNINITQIMKDSERGNLYRGVVSIEKLDGYIDTIRHLIEDAEETLK